MDVCILRKELRVRENGNKRGDMASKHRASFTDVTNKPEPLNNYSLR